jgi:hypothetical protein
MNLLSAITGVELNILYPFAAPNSMRFEQMGAFGTGILFIDYDVKEVLRYKCIHLKDVILGQNHQGVVNRVDRVMYKTNPEHPYYLSVLGL